MTLVILFYLYQTKLKMCTFQMQEIMNEILQEYRKEDIGSMGATPLWMVDSLISDLAFTSAEEKHVFRKLLVRIICEDRRRDCLYREAIIQLVLSEHLNL